MSFLIRPARVQATLGQSPTLLAPLDATSHPGPCSLRPSGFIHAAVHWSTFIEHLRCTRMIKVQREGNLSPNWSSDPPSSSAS